MLDKVVVLLILFVSSLTLINTVSSTNGHLEFDLLDARKNGSANITHLGEHYTYTNAKINLFNFKNGEEKPLPNPFIVEMSRALRNHEQITIEGKVNADAKNFEFNLKCPSTFINIDGEWISNQNIALHIKFRFERPARSIMNTFSRKNTGNNDNPRSTWGKQEYFSNYFRQGSPFVLKIQYDYNYFIVKIGDAVAAYYTHRVAQELCKDLDIRGDIEINRVDWRDKAYFLPFENGFLNEDLKISDNLRIYAYPYGTKFKISMLNKKGDVLFYYLADLEHRTTERNSIINGKVGMPETSGAFPDFKKNRIFRMFIYGGNPLKVEVNGNTACEFKDRFDWHNDNYHKIRIEGDLILKGFALCTFGNCIYP